MRVAIVLAILAIFLSLGGCSQKRHVAYVEPLPALPPSSRDTEPATITTKTYANVESSLSDTRSVGRQPPSVPDRKRVTREAVSPRGDTPSLASNKDWSARIITPSVARESEVKFATVQEKAERVGVENLTEVDIEGLSYNQIRQLRGY